MEKSCKKCTPNPVPETPKQPLHERYPLKITYFERGWPKILKNQL